MPTPQFPAIEDFYSTNAPLEDKVARLYDAYIGISRYLTYLLSALDTLNVSRLDAKVIKTGTLDANLVTIRSDLSGGAFIQLDSQGIRINNGIQDTFFADLSGNVTLRGTILASTILGSTFRAGNSRYILLDATGIKSYDALNRFDGFVLDITSAITRFDFYSGGAHLLEISGVGDISDPLLVRFINIKHGFDNSTITIGDVGKTTNALGTWNFNSANVSGLETDVAGDHNHGITPGTRLAITNDGLTISGYVTWISSGSHSHTVF